MDENQTRELRIICQAIKTQIQLWQKLQQEEEKTRQKLIRFLDKAEELLKSITSDDADLS